LVSVDSLVSCFPRDAVAVGQLSEAIVPHLIATKEVPTLIAYGNSEPGHECHLLQGEGNVTRVS